MMLPLMGFCQLSLFGGYAIYFPELFPTFLRSTGTSFLLQHRAKAVAATGPLTLGFLAGDVFAKNVRAPSALRRRDAQQHFSLGLTSPFRTGNTRKPLPE